MKIAIVQFAPRIREIDSNLTAVDRLIANTEADLFVLPELFSSGYLFSSREDILPFAEPFPEGKTTAFLAKISSEKDCAIVGGFPELSNGGVYNSAVLVAPGVEPVLYRKLHLFNTEKAVFAPGNLPLPIVEFRGAKVAFMICFDWIFPEVYRTLALRGAEIVCHLTNLVMPFCQRASYAHAVSNRLFIMISNRFGTETNGDAKVEFTGGSIAYSPTGEVLGELGATGEGLVIVEVDPSIARDKRINMFNDLLADRRPEFYDL